MKKTFTLALTLGILSSAFSQARVTRVSLTAPVISVDYDHRYNTDYAYTNYERNAAIKKINSDYNRQANQVMNLRIRASKKINLLKELQFEKSKKIQSVNNYFGDVHNNYNNQHYYRNSR